MPFTVKDAPPRNVLPKAALKLWVSTYNSVFDETGDEDQARQAAWSNVKKAGYEKGEDGKWHKADAGIADAVTVAIEELRPVALDRAVALALPSATPSKVYAEFRFFRFNVTNDNHDGFLFDDVSEEVVAALKGSPLYLDADWDKHPARAARATERAKFQAGTIVEAERREDGVYCIGAFQREVLEDRGIDPKRLAEFSTSMEVMFDRTKARYRLDGKDYNYQEALTAGIAAPLGDTDDPNKYDTRHIVPIEFHAGALLVRGRNADKGADVLRAAAASQEEEMDDELILQSAEDLDLEEQAEAAVLTGKERKKLKKSEFAYVDEKGEGHLPIQDAAHVKNALARLNQTKISADAKRSALKKILRAAKRLGVKVDMKSDVVKQYSDIAAAVHQDSLEEQLRKVSSAFYRQVGYSIDQESVYVQWTYSNYLIAQAGDKTFRVDFKVSGDEIDFEKPYEVEIEYRKVKKEAASMAETPQGTKTPDEPVILTPEKQKEIEEAAVAAAKPDIEKAAVEAHLAREKAFAERMKVLDAISPVTEAEKSDLEKKVREADEAGFPAIKMERMEAVLQALRKGKSTAEGPLAPAPTLRPGPETPQGDSDPFRVTIQK